MTHFGFLHCLAQTWVLSFCSSFPLLLVVLFNKACHGFIIIMLMSFYKVEIDHKKKKNLNVATPLWPSVGVKPNTWKSWRFGVLRDSRMFRVRQQGPKHLHWGVLGVIEKVLKRKCRKWPRIDNSNICSASYGQKKGRESN